jgi:hypothetical protein
MIAKTTKVPLRKCIYNDKDNSTTNQEGLFVFISGKTEINFNLLGYHSLKTITFLKNRRHDLFMEAKAF